MDSLFGSALRTQTLVAIGRLQLSFLSELARVLNRRPTEIARAVASLERAGVVASQRAGRTRLVRLDPRFHAASKLYALLLRLSEDPIYRKRWASIRKRPRAIGKPA